MQKMLNIGVWVFGCGLGPSKALGVTIRALSTVVVGIIVNILNFIADLNANISIHMLSCTVENLTAMDALESHGCSCQPIA